MASRLEGKTAEFSEESGLHIVENGPSNPVVDIIAVHGLAANPVYTWVKKIPSGAGEIGRLDQKKKIREVLWLKHLLPAKVPDARILKYNYASTYLKDAPKESLQSIASRLIHLIHDLRTKDLAAATRPIIFVGHSFGGIVIADALVYAYHHDDTTYKQIAESTCGIVFLGTPFRGSMASSWGVTLANCSAALGLRSDNRLLKTLLENSEVLERLLDNFKVMARKLPMKIICFYETEQTKLGIFGICLTSLVVDKGSATIDGHHARSLVSNHSDLNKFSSSANENFILVSGALKELVEWSHEFSLSKSGTLNNDLALYQNMPRCTENFTGREDYLSQMREYFGLGDLQLNSNSTSEQRKVFVLYGLGGSGKTQLALKFAELYRDCFDRIFFIDSSSAEVLENKLTDIAKQFNVGGSAEAALRWLDSGFRQSSFLLILDNADDPSLNLRKYFPNTGNLIITTRNKECKVHAPEGNINVVSLPPDDAIDLLLRASMLHLQYDKQHLMPSVRELTKELGYLPLAIAQAGAYIRRNSNLDEYLHLFKKQRKRILRYQNPKSQSQEDNLPVYTTWDLSYQKLSDSAKCLLKMCAFLHYESIPKSLFERGIAKLLKRECKVPQQLEQWEYTIRMYWTTDDEWDVFKFNDTLTELTLYSLINVTAEGQNFYSLHNLVQSWVQDSIEDIERLAIRTTVRMLTCLSVRNDPSAQEYIYRRQLLPHILVLSGVDDIGAQETTNAAFIFEANGLSLLAEKLFMQALQERKKILGGEHADTLTSMQHVASICLRQARWTEAEEFLGHILEARKRIFGEEHPSTVVCMNSLAIVYTNQGKWTEAEKLLEKTIEIKRKLFGEDRQTLASMNNLACLYSNQGRLAEAQELEERIVDVSKRIMGEEHPDTLVPMNNLAISYSRQGKLEQAEKLQKQTLEASRRVLGEEHPSTLNNMGNLGTIYLKQGKSSQAEKLQEQVLETTRRILGEEHPDTLINMSKLAFAYLRQGKKEQASKLQKKVTEASKSILGEEHPDTLTAIKNLATMYSSQRKLVQAKELQERVLVARKKILGEEHPDTLETMNELAVTYSEEGKFEQAEELQKEVIEVQKKVLGEEHPDILDTLGDLTGTYIREKKWAQAEKLAEQVLGLRKKILGEEHPDTLTSMRTLAMIYSNQGRLPEEEKLRLQALETSKKIFGEKHPKTIENMVKLEQLFNSQGRVAEANELVEQRLRISGDPREEHLNSLTSINNVASIDSKQGERTQAEKLQEQASEKNLGDEHPCTLAGVNDFASTCLKQGERTETERSEVSEARNKVFGEDHADTLLSVDSGLTLTNSNQGKSVMLQEKLLEAKHEVLGKSNTLKTASDLVTTKSPWHKFIRQARRFWSKLF